MKKWTRFMLALALTVLAGCGAASETLVEELPQEETEVSLAVEQALFYQVTVEEWSEQSQTEDGFPLVSYVCYLPVLSVTREDGSLVEEAQTEAEEQALAVTAAFNGKFEKWAEAEEFDSLTRSAEEDLAFRREEGLDWYDGYVLELDCTVYQTERMLSVCGSYYSYTGGAHPNTWQLGWNFDLEDGVFFEAELLCDDAELQGAVVEEILRQAAVPQENGYVPLEMYWEDHEDIIANWSSYAVTFDEAGMRVVFSPYELAPYAAGPQEFLLTYDWLRPYLSEHGRNLLEVQ